MALPIGLLLFVLGCVAMYAWSVEAFVFLKGAVPFGLLLWGLLAIIVGISERKAKREFGRALKDDPPAGGPNAEPESVS